MGFFNDALRSIAGPGLRHYFGKQDRKKEKALNQKVNAMYEAYQGGNGPGSNTPYMGPRGQTIRLGSPDPLPRDYAANPFYQGPIRDPGMNPSQMPVMGAPSGPPSVPSMSFGGPSPAPGKMQNTMIPPGTNPMPMAMASSPKTSPLVNALRSRQQPPYKVM